MIIAILKLIVFSTLLGIPLAIINASCFHGKEKKEIDYIVYRVLFTLVGALVFSMIITHLTLTLKNEQESMGWLFYALGLFFCIPYYLRSNLKENSDFDHFMDGIGIFACLLGYGVVIALWESFFSIPHKAGFLYEISSAINNLWS